MLAPSVRCGRTLTGRCRQQHDGTTLRARQTRLTCVASAGHAVRHKLKLQIGETGIVIPFDATNGKHLEAATAALLQTFAAKAKAERPKRWDIMEYQFYGDPAQHEVAFLEVACNPNGFSSAFDAKVLITVKTADGVQVTTEGKLSNFKADLDQFLQSVK